MEHDKNIFVIYYFTALIRLPKLTNLSQKLILLHQLKHVSIGFDDSKAVILFTRNGKDMKRKQIGFT